VAGYRVVSRYWRNLEQLLKEEDIYLGHSFNQILVFRLASSRCKATIRKNFFRRVVAAENWGPVTCGNLLQIHRLLVQIAANCYKYTGYLCKLLQIAKIATYAGFADPNFWL